MSAVIFFKQTTSFFIRAIFLLAGVLLTHLPVYALQPHEVLIIANLNVPESTELAEYYMSRRAIPRQNLLGVRVSSKETVSREEYMRDVLTPVREVLEARREMSPVRCLVLMTGIPLRIQPPAAALSVRAGQAGLNIELKKLEADLKLGARLTEPEKDEIAARIKELKGEIGKASLSDMGAALDSEIALALADGNYPLAMWIQNPFFEGFRGQKLRVEKRDVVMVSRLDGPSAQIVRRIIDDSLYVEANGLKGTAYFDARWPKPTNENLQGYAFYDNSIHNAAEQMRQSGRLDVVLDARSDLFQPGDCPDAALYCGWYSLAHYVDAFKWRRGAVAYHIASAECQTLKSGNSQVWCKRMLEEGVAATIGPVNEPYVQGFPVPEIFFGILSDGYYTLSEAYLLSIPFFSWQMVLVGDPLYRPFLVKPEAQAAER